MLSDRTGGDTGGEGRRGEAGATVLRVVCSSSAPHKSLLSIVSPFLLTFLIFCRNRKREEGRQTHLGWLRHKDALAIRMPPPDAKTSERESKKMKIRKRSKWKKTDS